MAHHLLQRLASDEFALSLGVTPTTASLVSALRAHTLVHELRAALDRQEVSQEMLRAFVDALLLELRRGESFLYQEALAAVAVALEERMTPFAVEYVRDLAQLRIAELRHASSVARVCKQVQHKQPHTELRTALLSPLRAELLPELGVSLSQAGTEKVLRGAARVPAGNAFLVPERRACDAPA